MQLYESYLIEGGGAVPQQGLQNKIWHNWKIIYLKLLFYVWLCLNEYIQGRKGREERKGCWDSPFAFKIS